MEVSDVPCSSPSIICHFYSVAIPATLTLGVPTKPTLYWFIGDFVITIVLTLVGIVGIVLMVSALIREHSEYATFTQLH
jgi:hypothetical protein